MAVQQSETIGALASALCALQGELQPVKMDSKNPFLGNNYASLGAVIAATRPLMTKYGLAIAQLVGSDDNRVSVTTMLMHTSGEWLRDTVSLEQGAEKGKTAAQVAGSTISYLRRYAYAAIIGATDTEDTDGNPAGSEPPRKAQPQPAPQPAPHWSKDDAARRAFWSAAKRLGHTVESAHQWLKVDHLADYPGTQAEALAALRAAHEVKR